MRKLRLAQVCRALSSLMSEPVSQLWGRLHLDLHNVDFKPQPRTADEAEFLDYGYGVSYR